MVAVVAHPVHELHEAAGAKRKDPTKSRVSAINETLLDERMALVLFTRHRVMELVENLKREV